MVIVTFVAGLVLLVVGAEALVRGAARLAALSGIPPLVVGLTVVAFGTSAPELAVSLGAARAGQASIALGNVVGSNVFNVLFILGASALVVPLVVARSLVRFDIPLMIVLSAAVPALAWDGTLGRLDGLLLLGGLAAYVLVLVRQARAERAPADDEFEHEYGARPRGAASVALQVALVVGGLVLLVLGSRWLVESAVEFARRLGTSELVIGLTIVAAGTSLPEVVTSLVAAVRGERDIAVGNVVGSNIFNLMGVLGAAAAATPAGIEVSPAVLGFDLPVMFLVAFACLPLAFTGGRISRLEGGLLLAYYAAYTAYLVLDATGHDALPLFSAVMLRFAIPLTLLTLVALAAREFRARRGGRG